jgi:hypothetical protein
MLFKIAWAIDALVAAIVFYFFLIGIADGSVSSFNIVLWLVILLALSGVLIGSRALRAAGHTGLATSSAMLVAVPGTLAGISFLVLILGNQRWN